MIELLKNKINDIPVFFVIFGGAGDLTHRKLLPAIFSLYRQKLLPENFKILGFSRKPLSDTEYRKSLYSKLKKDGKNTGKLWEKFTKNIFYHQGFFAERNDFEEISLKIEGFLKKFDYNAEIILYLATPAQAYYPIIQNIQSSKLRSICEGKNTRIVVEKPFGNDLKSAEILNKELKKVFKEEQIYRIDHYLGKETVQNLLFFRFANQAFDTSWDKKSIDHVQISILESIGLESRGTYYENAGALRDIIQNHALQLVAHIAMEKPEYFDEKHIRNEKADIIRSLRLYSKDEIREHIVRGQYKGYREEKGVDKSSYVETFVAMKLFIENERWENVPIYIRSGKKLKEKQTKIIIKFKGDEDLLISSDYCANTLTYNIQPDEGIEIKLLNKTPGKEKVELANLDLKYREEFKEKIPDAYETLILDIIRGDSTLFVRNDEIEASWEFVDHIRKEWNRMPPPNFPNYEKGTLGPNEAEDLIRRDGRKWIN
ncbi:glucose-6-phosphate dehydrogenase [Candidatus Dojkabacteria bacterium]|nr:glucose-6-phosphate dehydrogenase [Candidatus Dojkabacteria bacterium]